MYPALTPTNNLVDQPTPGVPKIAATSTNSYGLRTTQCAATSRYILALCIFFFTVAKSADFSAEHRIQNIQNNLLPAVLVAGEPNKTTTLAERMDELRIPGVSIAVVHGGKIDWARGFGVTQISGAPVTDQTLFQAASISKPVSALAALRLVQTGRVDLDTDVNKYLKSWKVPANSFTDQAKVTLRELLTHTAGTTVHGFPGYPSDVTLPTLTQILDGQRPANSSAVRVDTLPGSSSRYSGGGYMIVQQLLEDVTGLAFDKFMQTTVLTPIGMSSSTFSQPLPKSALPAIAIPHHANGQPVKGGPHVYPEQAAAGLWTTPADLARYVLEVQQSLAGKSNKVLSPAATREMLTPDKNQQGLGPHIGGSDQQPYFDHDGGNAGYRCYFVAYESGDGAVIMINSDNGQIIGEILRTIAAEYNWPNFQPRTHTIAKVDSENFDLLTGSYQLPSGLIMAFTREGEHFYSQATGQRRFEIWAESELGFFTREFASQITFNTDEQGRALNIVLHQNGRDIPGKRLDDETAKSIATALAAINERVKNQTAMPGSDAALRKLIDELAVGQPDYSKMGSLLTNATRQQLPQLQELLKKLGPILSTTFNGVNPGGADLYNVTYEHGSVQWRILLNDSGKIDVAGYQEVSMH